MLRTGRGLQLREPVHHSLYHQVVRAERLGDHIGAAARQDPLEVARSQQVGRNDAPPEGEARVSRG